MASADAADGVGHSHDGQTEGQGSAHDGGCVTSTAKGHSSAATQER